MAVQHSTTWASQAVVKKKYGYFSSSLNLLIQNLGHKLLGHWKWHPGPSMEIFFKRHFWTYKSGYQIGVWLHLMIKLREDVEYDLLFIDFLENILESTIILFENCIFCALKKEKNHNQEDVFQWSLRAKNKTKQTNKRKNQNFLWTHWAVTSLKIPTSNWLYWIIVDNPYIYFSYNDHYYKKLSLTMITSIHSKNEKINFKLKIENYK